MNKMKRKKPKAFNHGEMKPQLSEKQAMQNLSVISETSETTKKIKDRENNLNVQSSFSVLHT